MRFNYDAPDLYVELARYSIESLVAENAYAGLPEGLPSDLLEQGNGTFVSLHRRGKLRGCIGTMQATKSCIGEEILFNARSAATRDPRFPALKPVELDEIEYSVDVLTPCVPVEDVTELDPKVFGVMVEHGFKRGVLLPDLDGIDTVEEQLDIARRKAGIAQDEPIRISSFRVVRHTAGGEPRRG